MKFHTKPRLPNLHRKQRYTATTEKTGKYIKTKDLYGLFDLIAIKPKRTKLIQFKTNKQPTLKPFKNFANTYPQFEIEIWVWIDYEGFDKYACKPEQKHTLTH